MDESRDLSGRPPLQPVPEVEHGLPTLREGAGDAAVVIVGEAAFEHPLAAEQPGDLPGFDHAAHQVVPFAEGQFMKVIVQSH